MESNQRKKRKRPRSNLVDFGITRQTKQRKEDEKWPQKLSPKNYNKPEGHVKTKSYSRNGRMENKNRDSCKCPDDVSVNGVERDESYWDSMKILSERDINEIAQLEETEAVTEVFLKLKAFQEFLDADNQEKPDVLSNVLTILKKAVAVVEKSRHSKDSDALQRANRVIGEVLNGRHSKFEFYLKMYLDKVKGENLPELCCLFCKFLSIYPAESVYILPITEMERVIKQADLDNESFQQKVDEMITLYEKAKEKPTASRSTNTEEYDDSEYKNIPIIPQWTEISASKSLTRRRLRPNITKGSFDNWLHYFDIQFRLLREDFVAPLRKGVQDYLKGLRGRELSNVKVYTNVHIINIKCSKSGVCYQVNIGKPPRGSKRLIYGSLVCLSHDGFQENIFFGTVDNCDGIKRGVIDIKFCDDALSNSLLQYIVTKSFVMVESYVYFEAYRPILQSLKDSDGNSMPFTKYLIDVNSTDVSKPQYLVGNPNASFDLSHLVTDKVDGREDIGNVKKFSVMKHVSDITSWDPSVLNLDKSQAKALQNGLTQELSVIQGPPGTGKTYIGLKLVETLLKNKKNWNSTERFKSKSPILIMCYTNHALDQFLEGILDCPVYQKDSKSINLLRIGSRTNSERLSEFSIQNKKKTTQIPQLQFGTSFRDLKQSQLDCQMLWDRFKLSLETVIPSQRLKKFLDENHKYFFFRGKSSSEKSEKKLLFWLLPDDFQIPPEVDYQVSNKTSSNETSSFSMHEFTNGASFNLEQQEGAVELTEEYQDTDVGVDNNFLGIDHRNDISDYLPTEQKSADKDKFESIIPEILKFQEKFVRRTKINKFMQYLATVNPMSENEAMEQTDLNNLQWLERIKLYKHWVVKYQEYFSQYCTESFEKYNSSCTEMLQMRKVTDRYVIETATVIGMTTTGAAKYKDILQQVKPKIIIVEEAAEVLESHIVSALSNGTHHLILIGDHKQLRPKPNEYDLETNFNLGISLFERLIRNDHPHVTLNIQHRMRPEISQLVNSYIYDNILKNHPSVEEYPNVRGVKSNLFFIDHHQPESEDVNDCSHSNEHEADFLIALCRYLLQQNYSPSQITILVTYSGQLHKMRQKIREPKIKEQETILTEVRISTVDNFQGEENDIILLSLVRSNEERNIGFLKEDNRVCVALSRARQGFYCVGNFKLLCDSSFMWNSIISDLKSKEKISSKLTLQCHNHPEVTFEACNPSDFMKNSPHGGCDKKCASRLPCGHVCEKICHSSDPEHKSYRCRKKCNKVCQKKHPCERMCYQDCGPCMKKIEVMLSCGHMKTIKCSTDLSTVVCEAPCPQKCSARNHPCTKKCFEECGNCEVKIPQTIAECNHKVNLPCYIPPLHENCPKPCSKELSCGHRCALKCGEDCSNEVCKKEMEVELPCKHCILIPCWKRGTSGIQCNKLCEKKLDCTHGCTNRCCEPCVERCLVLVSKNYPCKHNKQDHCYKQSCTQPCEKKLNCGHPCHNFCGEPCEEFCQEPCGEVLACGHECEGICHSCKSSKVHKLCHLKVDTKRFCGHQQTVSCTGLNDRGCAKSHEIICIHGSQVIHCKSSTLVHSVCQQPCMWRCPHNRCYNLCFEICSRRPCNRLCQEELNCGHKCPGLCGEPCLKLCPSCDYKQFMNQLKCFAQPNSTYYRLPCDHIFTVKYLDDYTRKSLHLVSGPLLCPHKPCGKPMSTCYRYGNVAKHYLEQIQQVKHQINYNEQLFKGQLLNLLKILKESALMKGHHFDLQLLNTELHNNLPDRLYLAMLLARIVNTAELVNDSSSNIRTELENQMEELFVLSRSPSLSYTAVQNCEQKYLQRCLAVQIYQAKKICPKSREIQKAEGFLTVSAKKNIKVEMTTKKFCMYSKALANDFPQTVSGDFQNYVSAVVLQYPFLQKGLWWHCDKKRHYYCIPASISKIVEHNCPVCAGSFLGYVKFSRDIPNQPLQTPATPFTGPSGAENGRISLNNKGKITIIANSQTQIKQQVHPKPCSTSSYRYTSKIVYRQTGRGNGGTPQRLPIQHHMGPNNSHRKRKLQAEELEDGEIDEELRPVFERLGASVVQNLGYDRGRHNESPHINRRARKRPRLN